MVRSEKGESEDAAESALRRRAPGSHDITHTLRGPVLKISLLPKPLPPAPRERPAGWKILWETDPPVLPLQLGPGAPWPKTQRFTPAFLASAVFQSAIVYFLYSIPFAMFLAWFM